MQLTTTQTGARRHIPSYKSDVVAGFSHEYLRYMQGGYYRGSFRPLNDAVIAGASAAWPAWSAATTPA